MASQELAAGYEIRKMDFQELHPYLEQWEWPLFKDEDWYFDIDQVLTQAEKSKIALLEGRLENIFQVNLAVFFQGEFVGWCYGRQSTIKDNIAEFYIYSALVFKEHRRKGLYTAMLNKVIELCRAEGVQVIIINHVVTNNPVIIAGLKSGFYITGINITDGFGTNVQLSYHLNEKRDHLLNVRAGHHRILEEDLPVTLHAFEE